MKLFGVYDSVSSHYLAWLVEQNEGTCVRSILSRFGNTDFNSFSSDFSLYELADVDDSTGVITPVNPTLVKRFSDIFKAGVENAV